LLSVLSSSSRQQKSHYAASLQTRCLASLRFRRGTCSHRVSCSCCDRAKCSRRYHCSSSLFSRFFLRPYLSFLPSGRETLLSRFRFREKSSSPHHGRSYTRRTQRREETKWPYLAQQKKMLVWEFFSDRKSVRSWLRKKHSLNFFPRLKKSVGGPLMTSLLLREGRGPRLSEFPCRGLFLL